MHGKKEQVEATQGRRRRAVSISGLTSPPSCFSGWLWCKPDLGGSELLISDISVSREVGMPDLSQDIIVDILSRLPLKSVCRFRCVSKSWFNLTTEPHFINTHLNRHRKKQKIILSSNNSLFSLDPEAPIDDDMLPLEIDFPLKNHPNTEWVHMFGSCNGLVCIMPQPEAFFIFNPTTRESLRVPDCPRPSHICPPEPQEVMFHHAYSFGYAPSIDDYKFVKVAYGCMVLIFSLKSSSWKRVQDFPYKHCLEKSGTTLNGAVHWLCRRLEVGGTCVIAAFDLAQEKFSDLPPPESVTDYKRFTTGVLRGCLCLLHQHDRRHSFWIMNKYGVKESWTMIMITDSYSSISLKPLCYWKDTKILLARSWKQLLLCNPNDGTCKNFLGNGLPDKFCADVYVECLVSPNLWFRRNSRLRLAPITVLYTFLLLVHMNYLLLVTELSKFLTKKSN
ncbi:F-box/kelch-repeat protein At3g06240-like isoform X3 [Prunus dulcis]|uniref:F-box/kelch-repeat protein At3g06240-like isoform X3 n=1 Tax=Prunus dulcis TaxID=3755 RepID=UPI00148289F0|nr:F-box/kelch-repeat protein At3g06240-like isoform X3 [Prunus dulcis]